MPRHKKKPVTRRALPGDDDTLAALNLLRAEAVAWRDEVAEKLEREHGIKLAKKGSVEVRLEAINGMGSLQWTFWELEKKA